MKKNQTKTRQSRLTGKNKKGFSLLEVLMAFFILITGILGILMMITNSLTNSAQSRDVISASQLAQEGIELVRWVRDNNVASGLAFANGMSLATNCRISYSIATTPPGYPDCSLPNSNLSDFAMYYNSEGGFWFTNHASSGNTLKFKRLIRIEDGAVPDDEKTVKSFVFWGSVMPSADASNCTEVNKCIYAVGKITSWDE